MHIVPVILDLKLDEQVVKDQFCWDATSNDEAVEAFCTIFCAEARLQAAFHSKVKESIMQQVAAFLAEDDQSSRGPRSSNAERIEQLRYVCHLANVQGGRCQVIHAEGICLQHRLMYGIRQSL